LLRGAEKRESQNAFTKSAMRLPFFAYTSSQGKKPGVLLLTLPPKVAKKARLVLQNAWEMLSLLKFVKLAALRQPNFLT